MKYVLNFNPKNSSNQDILNDVKKYIFKNNNSISIRKYTKKGKFGRKIIYNRFGSWNNLLKKLGVRHNVIRDISINELFINLDSAWKSLGRQPTIREMKKYSKYTAKPYITRFGNWKKACEIFVRTKQSKLEYKKLINKNKIIRTRNIKEKDRLKIYKRDNYKCKKCGKSPATHINIYLEIDHINPFSKGGTNELSNLQTLCHICNRAKNNDETV